jgi:inosine-uridine nucleoside N-ribohydrolase
MRLRTTTSFLLAGVLAVAGCADDDSTTTPPTSVDRPLPVIVDTDGGLDDAIALAYLARAPEVDLLAVTVSGTGLAHCFPGARNVVGLLEAMGAAGVPVACGAEATLATMGRAFPDEWRRTTDARYGAAWPIGRGSLDRRSAEELLVDTLDAAERPVTLVTLGPLTNVAGALALDPELGDGIARVVTMGGAFDVPGNTADAMPAPARTVAEWNIYVDAAAARAVAGAGLPLSFVPLDATNEVPLDAYLLRALARAPGSDAVELTRTLLARMEEMIAGGEYYLWDPLAAVLALHPELGRTEERSVAVVADGDDVGRTMTSPEGTPAEVFVAVDARAAEAALLEGLAGRRVPDIVEEPDLVIDPVACTVEAPTVASGPSVLHLAPASRSFIAVGTIDRGYGPADIAAYLANPSAAEPEWFTTSAFLGGDPAVTTALATLTPGVYTAACIDGTWGAMELRSTTTFTVTP